MLKQGRKREAKGLAVLYFIIGLIILLIILAVIYFALAKLDYSDKLEDMVRISETDDSGREKTEAQKLIERVNAIQKELAARQGPSEEEQVFTEEALRHYDAMWNARFPAGNRRYKGGRYFR